MSDRVTNIENNELSVENVFMNGLIVLANAAHTMVYIII